MPDADIPTEAEDIFGLNANFKRTTGNKVPENQTAEQLDEFGQLACSNQYGGKDNYSASYGYCGTDLAADFDLKLSEVVNAAGANKIIDSIEISFSVDGFAQVSISGHNHTDGNEHAPATSGNFDGFDLDLAKLIGSNQAVGEIKIIDYTNLALDTVTVNALVVTEGTDWTAATSNASTATSLAGAINALAGLSATATGDKVSILADVFGLAGNAYNLLTSGAVADIVLSGSTLTGGRDAFDGFGIPLLWTNTDLDSDYQSLSLSFSADHNDNMDHLGGHLVGVSSNGRVTATAGFIGIPVLNTYFWTMTADPSRETSNQNPLASNASGFQVLARTLEP
jgi:hypothetical protein